MQGKKEYGRNESVKGGILTVNGISILIHRHQMTPSHLMITHVKRRISLL